MRIKNFLFIIALAFCLFSLDVQAQECPKHEVPTLEAACTQQCFDEFVADRQFCEDVSRGDDGIIIPEIYNDCMFYFARPKHADCTGECLVCNPEWHPSSGIGPIRYDK